MLLPKCLNLALENTRWSPPDDVRDLVIRLETEGVSDSVAREDYGFADTWQMAETYFPSVSAHAARVTEIQLLPPPGSRGAFLDYLAGTSFALPLLFSCLAILLLRFSLWGGDLPARQASAIALGIALSFILSGGFVQAMSRQGLWYMGTGQLRRCAQSTWRWLRYAGIALLFLGIAGVATSVHFDWFPIPLYWLAAVFYFVLSLLWLCTGVLYMLERNLLVGLIAVLGIGSVVLLHRGLHLNLLASQIISIVLAACVMQAVAVFILNRQSRNDRGDARPEPAARTLYYLWPYFLYGLLYYLFLFADRLIAWTAPGEASGLTVQFRGAYESAQDVALFAFIFQVGWVHSATVRFYRRLQDRQREFSIDQSQEFNRSLTKEYFCMAISFVPLMIASTALVYLFAWVFGFLTHPMHRRVMEWALAGYILLVMGLRNVSVLFALSRPFSVLWAIGSACIANIGFGYVLSRFGSYDLAVIGFALGSAVFAAVSTWHSVQTLRSLDYYYFASAV